MDEMIGLMAGLCTTISFIPQVIRTVRTKDTTGISLYMYIIFVLGVSLWLVFGFLIQSKSVIFTNSATIVLSGIILFMKIRNLLSHKKGESMQGK
jgi:MtN3 and saliva related transmembrane protein